MSEFVEHKDFNDALESFKKEHPDCRIETFSGTTQQIIDGFNIKEYPFLVDRSFPKFLIKVGREEHMLPLLKRGVVFMNPLGYFKNLEQNGDGRADEAEGAHSIVQTGGMIINGVEINMPTPLTVFAPGYNIGYVYCLVAVYDDTKPGELLNERMLDMGEVAIVIHDPEQFVHRCADVLKAHGLNLEWGRVRYYDKTDGSFLLDPWLKLKNFEYQKEFRLFFPMVESKAKVLQIGSIEDIALAYRIQRKQ